MRPLRPRSCSIRLKLSRTSSPPLSAQHPLGSPGGRRLTQTKTWRSKCGAAIDLRLAGRLTKRGRRRRLDTRRRVAPPLAGARASRAVLLRATLEAIALLARALG